MGLFKIPLRLLSKKLKIPSTLQEVSIFFPSCEPPIIQKLLESS